MKEVRGAQQQRVELVDVLTLGGAAADWPEDARTLVLGYGRVLLLLDSDEGGVARLSAMFATANPVPLPNDQDVTDFYRSGEDLRALLAPHTWQPQRPLNVGCGLYLNGAACSDS